MPFKTFTASVLSSADMNTYLMKQAVITCTSGTRPAAPVQGMTIYETDTNLKASYDGTSWIYDGGYQNYTPTLTNVALGNGTISGRYAKVGNNIRGVLRFTAGTTSSYSAGTLAFGLPFAMSASHVANDIVGHGQINNGTTASRQNVEAIAQSSGASSLALVYDAGVVTNAAPFTFGTSAVIYVQFDYEKA